MLNIGEWLIRSSNNMTDFPRDFTIAFAPVPRLFEDQADFINRGGLGDFVSINAKSPNIEAAWEFLKWYADGGMAPMAAGGRLPASKDVDMETAMQNLLGDMADTYDIESLEYVLYGDQNRPTCAVCRIKSSIFAHRNMRNTSLENSLLTRRLRTWSHQMIF